MHKVAVVYGTRPEALKMYPVYMELKNSKRLQPVLIEVRQHTNLLSNLFEFFGEKPDVIIDCPKIDAASVFEKVFASIQNYDIADLDFVLVHGDTATSFAFALKAFLSQKPIGHVEAGLRSFDLSAPFPEEGFRQMTSRLASYHFAPTTRARDNLIKEGVSARKILVCGNTIVDTIHFLEQRSECGELHDLIDAGKSFAVEVTEKPFILITIHRYENVSKNLHVVFESIKVLASMFPNIDFIFPVHPNPEIRHSLSLFKKCLNIFLVEPVNYPQFITLMKKSMCIISDSGGVQEEAAIIGKRVFVVRTITERPEAVECGIAVIVGVTATGIVNPVSEFINESLMIEDYSKLPPSTIFGTPSVSIKIQQTLERLIQN